MLRKLRYLLWPFSLLYGLVIVIRNKAYDWNILKSKDFQIPILVVGNLAVGGAGKSPMTEYLIRLLSGKYRLATLSRGYGRKTKGFILVDVTDSATKVGDEPLQFKRKFPEITVAVCEDRVEGVRKLKDKHDLIILDDAFQHRALKPGFSILLLEYHSLLNAKLLLPAGNFRDSFSQRKRADIIIVSKSPQELSAVQKQGILKRVDAYPNQKVMFSYLSYGQAYFLGIKKPGKSDFEKYELNSDSTILVLVAIADPLPLIQYLQSRVKHVEALSYRDHHQYTEQDLEKVWIRFQSLEGEEKVILTTEKDAQRLRDPSLSVFIQHLPIVVLPVETAFTEDDQGMLSTEIFTYLSSRHKQGQRS